MEKQPIYLQIAAGFRQMVLDGKLKPGDRLPPVRNLTTEWKCTPGTVHRAYQELARQGLVVSRPGQGTQVISKPVNPQDTPMRRAALIHRAESFLLEALNSGHSTDEIDIAIRAAMDRWRSIEKQPAKPPTRTLRFIGSHDLAITWMAAHFNEIVSGYSLQLGFTGSLGGLRMLADGNADLAGCHLWDQDSSDYNVPFIRKLFPNQSMTLVTLAHRRLGLILPVGNTLNIRGLSDLVKPGVEFVNRQAGSGTRVWLDSQLKQEGIDPAHFSGYSNERATHSEVAQVIAEGRANAGVGLEASARHFGLDFIFLTRERYDLVFYKEKLSHPAFKQLLQWLNTFNARQVIGELGGYETEATGKMIDVG